MKNSKQKLKLLEMPFINQLLYDYTVMYMTEVIGISNIPSNTPEVCVKVIEELKRSYSDNSPAQENSSQIDLEDAIRSLKQIYPKQFEKHGK